MLTALLSLLHCYLGRLSCLKVTYSSINIYRQLISPGSRRNRTLMLGDTARQTSNICGSTQRVEVSNTIYDCCLIAGYHHDRQQKHSYEEILPGW